MSHAVTAEYDFQLKAAERDNTCLVTKDPSARRHYNRLVEQGTVVSPMRGMYARAEYWKDLSFDRQHLHMVRALAKKHPSWVFSHFTAALLHGLYVSFYDLKQIHRIVSYESKTGSKKLYNHVSDTQDIAEVDGIAVTSFEQTVFDCMKCSEFEDALAIADSACRIRNLASWEICDIIDAMASKYLGGLSVARFAASKADGRSESGGESIARAKMIKLGYMLPDLQVKIPDPIDEDNEYRADFFWKLPDGGLLVGELDGHEKYVNPEMTDGKTVEEVLIDERRRESHVNAHRIPVMRFSYADIVSEARFSRIMDAFGVPLVGDSTAGLDGNGDAK